MDTPKRYTAELMEQEHVAMMEASRKGTTPVEAQGEEVDLALEAYKLLSVDEVLKAVEAGAYSKEAALTLEKTLSKPRKDLLKKLSA